MRRFVGVGLLLASFALLSTLNGYAQDPVKKGKVTTSPLDSSNLTGDEYVGVLKSVPGSDRLFNLEVQTVKYVPIPGRRVSPRLLNGNGPGVRRYNAAVNRILNLNTQITQAQAQAQRARTVAQKRPAAQKKINSVTNQVANAVAQLQRAAPAAQNELVAQGIADFPGPAGPPGRAHLADLRVPGPGRSQGPHHDPARAVRRQGQRQEVHQGREGSAQGQGQETARL